MIQSVRANDGYSSQLFQWDKEKRIASIKHGKDIWLCKLSENNDFVCFGREIKIKAHDNRSLNINKSAKLNS